MDAQPRVAVVGGGISGLASAYYLRTLDDRCRPDVTLIEADDRLGGRIRTSRVAGTPVDTGPDAFLSRSPRLRALVEELGLTDTVVAPSSGAYVWSRGRLRPLPPGAVFGVPERLMPLLRSGLLSPLGVLRAGLDLVMPSTTMPADPSVGEMLRPRFGTEVFNRLVEPLLGGVHAGRADVLSAASTVPELESMARRSRSMYLGLRRQRAARARAAAGAAAASGAGAPAGPALVGLSGGLGSLVSALAERLPAASIRLGAQVLSMDRTVGGYRLHVSDGAVVDADAVVLATPAFAAADLIEHLVPQTAETLREVPYVDVASLTFAFEPTAVGHAMRGTGFLVPPEEKRLVVGCTWLSAKWPHLAGGSTILVRCLVGRYNDSRFMALDDEALTRAVYEEISGVLGLTGEPVQVHIQRYPQAMPQYTVGHAGRLTDIDAGMAQIPGMYLTGAAYRGVGLAGCVAQAATVAGTVLDFVGRPAEGRADTGRGGGRASAVPAAGAAGAPDELAAARRAQEAVGRR